MISYNMARHVSAIIIELEWDRPYYYDIQTIVNLLTNEAIKNGKEKRKTRLRKHIKADPKKWKGRVKTNDRVKPKSKVISKTSKDWSWKGKQTKQVQSRYNRKGNK